MATRAVSLSWDRRPVGCTRGPPPTHTHTPAGRQPCGPALLAGDVSPAPAADSGFRAPSPSAAAAAADPSLPAETLPAAPRGLGLPRGAGALPSRGRRLPLSSQSSSGAQAELP